MYYTHLTILLALPIITWLVYRYHSTVVKRVRLLVKDCGIVYNLLTLLPGYISLRRGSSDEFWSERVKRFKNNLLVDGLTFRQVDLRATQLSDVLAQAGALHSAPLGLFIQIAAPGPQLVMTTLAMCFMNQVPLALLHQSSRGESLRHQVNTVTGMGSILVSPSLVRSLIAALGEEAWHIDLTVFMKGFQLCLLRRTVTTKARDEHLTIDPPLSTKPPADRTAVIMFTSGSTGLPKAVEVSHFKFCIVGAKFKQEFRLTEEDRIFVSAPLTRNMWAMSSAVYTGCYLVHGQPDIASVHESRATVVQASYQDTIDIIQTGDSTHTIPDVRVWFANPFPGNTHSIIKQRWPHIELVHFYGNCEGVVGLFQRSEDGASLGYRMQSVPTKALPLQLIQLDDSEDIVRGSDGFCIRATEGLAIHRQSRFSKGNPYMNADTTQLMQDVFRKGDVYYSMADVLKEDQEGNLYFVKRLGNSFRYLNCNVSCDMLEQFVLKLDFVKNCSVYSVKHPDYLHQVGMLAVQTSFPPLLTLSSLYSNISANFPRLPYFIRIMNYLPLLETRKVNSRVLKNEGWCRDNVYVLDDSSKSYVRLEIVKDLHDQ